MIELIVISFAFTLPLQPSFMDVNMEVGQISRHFQSRLLQRKMTNETVAENLENVT